MSTITSQSRSVYGTTSSMKDSPDNRKSTHTEQKIENRLNIKDLEVLQEAFMAEGEGYNNKLSLNKDQFCQALSLILNKGNKNEFCDLFDKIDVTKEGYVDWDKFASHMLLEFYERDDRVKSSQVPQWRDLKPMSSPHKETIQGVSFLKNTSRYIAISKEGCASMYGADLKLQRSLKTGTGSCKARDVWVTHFVPLQNINKIALAFTSKEIAFYDLSTKLEFNCQYKLQGLDYTPLCLDYWYNPSNVNEALIVWGDTGGGVNAVHFKSVNIALFERPPVPSGEKQEQCLNVQLSDIQRGKYKNASYTYYQGHAEWVRQVKYSHYLECFISCTTTTETSVVIGWLEKQSTAKQSPKPTTFQISQGVNAIDYYEHLNLIATAGVNHHVCLWNPYVVSKPTGVLRGHMASVIQVQFNSSRGQLISFSKDKVLRIWDVQLQVCLQRLAGMFPKGNEVLSTLYFDEAKSRLFITFNYHLTVMEMKMENRDRVVSHDKPVVAAIYNSVFNQVISVCQGGSLTMWMVDTGQKVKQFHNLHAGHEVTCLIQDHNETRLFTGSTDGMVKIWDMNGHCYHILECHGGQPVDIAQIVILKRSIVVVGWSKYVTVFRNSAFKDYNVSPSPWKGGKAHTEDILAADFVEPNLLATGAYDGEIVIWNTNSEQSSRCLDQRSRKAKSRGKSGGPASRGVSRGLSASGAFDSHTFMTTRPVSRPKSRAMSRVSEASNDEQNEFGMGITKLLFLKSRKGNPGGADIMSCGGNGWVRFWNSTQSALCGEFVAHAHAGSVIMVIDKSCTYLATGDVDGFIKVWNISEYCVESSSVVNRQPPLLVSHFQPHIDMINTLEIFERNERLIVLSSASDCTVAMWDVNGNHIGVFGQESHWKIEPIPVAMEEEEEDVVEAPRVEFEVVDTVIPQRDPTWQPDHHATDNPMECRVNSWSQTILGKDYAELRVKKRERRQPTKIPDLPYLHWERTGQPPAGPYAALQTKDLLETNILHKPDAEKYFLMRPSSTDLPSQSRLPALAETLKTAFDEKTLFPRYILDYESKMKQFHQNTLPQTQVKSKPGRGFQSINLQLSSAAPSRNLMSARRSGTKMMKLKPIAATGGPQIGSLQEE